jgi:hypothetical protein
MDLGLTQDQQVWLEGKGASVARPRWHLPQSDDVLKLHFFKEKMAVYQSYACPWFPEYFLGFDYYMWMDADMWVQNPDAIHWYVEALRRGADLVITPEQDRSYWQTWRFKGLWFNNLTAAYGQETAMQMMFSPMMNGGFGAARADGRLWKAWQDEMLAHGLSGAEFMQMVTLQHVILNGAIRTHFMPATCNWMCKFSTPALDAETGELVTPHYPHEKIHVLHMHDGSWRGEHALLRTDGQTETLSLRYGALKERRRACP